jgi:hypothetical protein
MKRAGVFRPFFVEKFRINKRDGLKFGILVDVDKSQKNEKD